MKFIIVQVSQIRYVVAEQKVGGEYAAITKRLNHKQCVEALHLISTTDVSDYPEWLDDAIAECITGHFEA